ncbi:MAG: AsmA family protein, partial [Woeseiaceae bacterium]
MRIARNILIGFAALLAVTIVLLLTVDLGRFKGTTEVFVSDMLGRDFTIGGQFQVHLGRQIHIIAEDVQLADADWSSNDAFARVGRFEGTIDTWSLISSPIRVEKLRVDNVRVNLMSSESGQDNWDLFPADEADDDQPQERLTLPAILVDALIADLVLSYDAPQRPQPLTFTATEIRAVQTDADALQLDLSGDINETPLELMASAGVLENLVDFRDVDFDLSGRLGEIRFDGEAAVDDVLQPRRPTASVKVQGPNAEYLTDILRLQRLTTGPLDLTATIVPVGNKMQLLVNGVFGEFALDVSGQFVDLQDLQEADFRIAASGPD